MNDGLPFANSFQPTTSQGVGPWYTSAGERSLDSFAISRASISILPLTVVSLLGTKAADERRSMEHNSGNRGDGDEGEDESALVDAFFLPGGILDPEDEADMGYKGDVPYKDSLPFLVPTLPSPVSLNPWESSQADNATTERNPVDPAAKLGTDDPSPQSLLSDISLPALSPPRQQDKNVTSFLPRIIVAPPASVIVPPPGFHLSVSQKADSIDTVSSLIEDDTHKKHALNLVEQVKTGGSTSFADVIRSSPPAAFTTPERKSNQRQSRYHTNSENNEKSYELKISKPQIKSSSPDVRNGTPRSAVRKSRKRTNHTSKQNGKATIPSAEWNCVDRNSVGRVISRLGNSTGTSPSLRQNSIEYPVLFDDSDYGNQSTSDSSSEPPVDPPDAVKVKRSQIPQIDTNRDTMEDNDDKAELSLTSQSELLQIKHCKPIESCGCLQSISAASSSEPSNVVAKRNTAITQNESVSKEVFAVLAPLFGQLIVSTSSVVLFLWKVIQLVTAGARNVLIYATWESSRMDGALSCYLVLYMLPAICDWIMAYVSLPHFSPHIISTVSLYFLCGFPDKSMTTNSSKVSDGVCRLILNTFRFYLPLTMFLEGFRGPNSTIMTLDKSTRLILAYFLSMLRAGLLFSPVGWLGWSFQVIISIWLPEGILLNCILSLLGLALIRLTSVLPAQRAASMHRI